MKYVTSIDDTEFNTPSAAVHYILNNVGSEAIRIKFEEGITDILETIDTDSYTNMLREYVEKTFDEINDAFEFDEADSFTIFGETIKII